LDLLGLAYFDALCLVAVDGAGLAAVMYVKCMQKSCDRLDWAGLAGPGRWFFRTEQAYLDAVGWARTS